MATVIDGTTGVSQVQDGVIVEADLANNAVTTAKLNDAAVTSDKLATAVQPIGVGQTWQDVLASRAVGTTYTNSTGRSIAVVASGSISSFANYQIRLTVSGIVVNATAGSLNSDGGCFNSVYATIPAGATYIVSTSAGTLNIDYWAELR